MGRRRHPVDNRDHNGPRRSWFRLRNILWHMSDVAMRGAD